MKPVVEVISTEMVKPSSSTPHHLRHYNLSFIDQITPQVNNSMVYFFDADDVANKFNINEVSDHLKKSLSQVLTHFYPLAGRLISENLIVDCNDEGVPFIETRVSCHLRHITDNPSLADVSKLLPYDMDEMVNTLLGAQFNVFDCGGIAVGVCISHKVGDALSYFQFIKSWAAVTRGEPAEQIRTHFKSSSLFPPKDTSGFYRRTSTIGKHKIVCKRFVFEASVIESLRTKYSQKIENVPEGQQPPSRVVAVSAFLWTRFVAATKKEGSKQIHLVGWTANLRPRMEPPLPEHAFGNYYWYLQTFPTLDEQGECNDDLGSLLRQELSKIDKDFVVKLREREECLNPIREDIFRAIEKGEMVPFSFTSLCRFPVYEVDFGWGNPTSAVPPTWKFKNLVSLKDTKSGGGIEAYVSLTEDDMAKFERDVELVAHVSTTGLK
ncbi:stemmadenine O-acetyltransferase-like [Prosopis cineraria]|uniref:stemmadenine O-acetyltransferase-like n=1 Tax=Prosopis cineraria TaxID=364024 RepID=UPI002410135B|nr:stemmadenine O-acetyltransferase-like [Prosopis cineraria]